MFQRKYRIVSLLRAETRKHLVSVVSNLDADHVDSDPRSIIPCPCDAAVTMTIISYHVASCTPSGTNYSGIPKVITAQFSLKVADAFTAKNVWIRQELLTYGKSRACLLQDRW
jgi:hypothetical protein